MAKALAVFTPSASAFSSATASGWMIKFSSLGSMFSGMSLSGFSTGMSVTAFCAAFVNAFRSAFGTAPLNEGNPVYMYAVGPTIVIFYEASNSSYAPWWQHPGSGSTVESTLLYNLNPDPTVNPTAMVGAAAAAIKAIVH